MRKVIFLISFILFLFSFLFMRYIYADDISLPTVHLEQTVINFSDNDLENNIDFYLFNSNPSDNVISYNIEVSSDGLIDTHNNRNILPVTFNYDDKEKKFDLSEKIITKTDSNKNTINIVTQKATKIGDYIGTATININLLEIKENTKSLWETIKKKSISDDSTFTTFSDYHRGVYQMHTTKNNIFPIYYYKGWSDENNVLLGDYCFQMIRTTDTGGIKMVYNGVVHEGSCAGYASEKNLHSADNPSESIKGFQNWYFYDIEFVNPNYTYKLVNPIKITNIEEANGKYSCRSSELQERCKTGTMYGLYKYGPTFNYKYTNNTDYLTKDSFKKLQLYSPGVIDFVDFYNNNTFKSGSYMYGDTTYTVNTLYYVDESFFYMNMGNSEYTKSARKLSMKKSVNTHPFIGDGYTYDAETNTYTLVNPEEYTYTYKSDTESQLYRKFFCAEDGAISCTKMYYILPYRTTYSTLEGYAFSDGEKIEDLINQARSLTPLYFANDVDYINGKYHLKDIYETNKVDFGANYETIKRKYHYFCLNGTTECEEVSYYGGYKQYNGGGSYSYQLKYVNLKNNDRNTDIFAKSHAPEVDSEPKKVIDKWYEEKIINNNLNKYIEDTIWCNNRERTKANIFDNLTIPDGEIPDVGNVYQKPTLLWLYSSVSKTYDYTFEERYNSLNTCTKADSFTVSSDIGNGKLKYPTGLLTMDEAMLTSSHTSVPGKNRYFDYNTPLVNSIRSQQTFVMTPYRANILNMLNYNIYRLKGASDTNDIVFYVEGYKAQVIPAISLKNSVTYTSGNGSIENPYKIKLD